MMEVGKIILIFLYCLTILHLKLEIGETTHYGYHYMNYTSCKRDERDVIEFQTLEAALESCKADYECGCISDWNCDNETYYAYKGSHIVNDSADCSWTKIIDSGCPTVVTVYYPTAVSILKDKFGKYNLKSYDENENGIYEHSLGNGNFLYKIDENDYWWLIGKKIGENYGWIGHLNCSEKCPNNCKQKNWWYWNENENNGTWYLDKRIQICDSRNILCANKALNDAEEMSLAEKQEQNKLMGISFFTSGLGILFLGLLILFILVKVC